LKVVKLHLLEHFSLFIRLFGAPKYWDTVLSEARHKAVKVDVQTTSNREHTFQGEILRKQTSDQINGSGKPEKRKEPTTGIVDPGGTLVGTVYTDELGHGETAWNWSRTELKWLQRSSIWSCTPALDDGAGHKGPQLESEFVQYLFPGKNFASFILLLST
jgi:hypothetical protein